MNGIPISPLKQSQSVIAEHASLVREALPTVRAWFLHPLFAWTLGGAATIRIVMGSSPKQGAGFGFAT